MSAPHQQFVPPLPSPSAPEPATATPTLDWENDVNPLLALSFVLVRMGHGDMAGFLTVQHFELADLRSRLATATEENERLKKLDAIVSVERGIDGGFPEGGLLAVGQALLTRAARIEELELHLATAERSLYPHMCRDGHEEMEIGWRGDGEQCPVCRSVERERALREAADAWMSLDLSDGDAMTKVYNLLRPAPPRATPTPPEASSEQQNAEGWTKNGQPQAPLTREKE